MQVVEIEGIIFFTIMIASLILFFINAILWVTLHNILYKKLDALLFRKPWFSPAELVMYSSWPLSLIKSMLYMVLISFPNFSKKRRFKGINQNLEIKGILMITCKACVYLLFLTTFFGIAFFLYGGWLYVITN